MSDKEDAERYRFLLTKVVVSGACRDGPDHPQLIYWADLWNEHPEIPARDRIQHKIGLNGDGDLLCLIVNISMHM